MLYELECVFDESLPSDEQSACIEVFFDGSNDFWKESGLSVDTGSDAETVTMINYFLACVDTGISDNIRKMLNDWKEEGF